MTMAEVVVTTSIMSLVGAIFTAGVVLLYHAYDRSEATSITQSQVTTAFLRLDRELRYATGIGPVHSDGTNRYVEYLDTDTPTGSPQ